VPLAINSILYVVTRFSNRAETSTDITKNRVVSFAGLIMTGVISLAHSYFIPLWLLPLFAIVICSIFHDMYIQMIEAGLSFVFILYSGIMHIYDYPDQRSFSIFCIILAEVMAIGISVLSFKLESYNMKMLIIRERNLAGANKYENGFEIDSTSGVYSKKYLIEQASDILKDTNELDPSGIALLDIDDFKKVTDEYGYDKGDDVLSALGNILQGCIDEDTLVGRYGRDVFMIVFGNGIREENLIRLNQIKKDFSKKKYSFMKDSVTVSGGYAWFDVTMDLDSAIKEAEAALASAKNSGKNKIMSTGEREDLTDG
jgi:diguanylate cyclase (GGDEF)-like protein